MERKQFYSDKYCLKAITLSKNCQVKHKKYTNALGKASASADCGGEFHRLLM